MSQFSHFSSRVMTAVLLLFVLQVNSQNNYPVLQPAAPAAAGVSAERLNRIDQNINEWIKDGRLNGLCHIGTINTGAGIQVVCSKTNLVVDYQVDGSPGAVSFEF